MALSLRQARPEDFTAIVSLMNRSYRSTEAAGGWTSEASYIEGDRTSEALMVQEIAAKPDGMFLIANELATPLQGCVWLEPLSTAVWYLGSLTVDPALQKGGVGRQLLAAAEHWALVRGAQVLRITVVNVRTTLIAWYERRGYQLTGETQPFPYGDNRFGRPLRGDLAFLVLEKQLISLSG